MSETTNLDKILDLYNKKSHECRTSLPNERALCLLMHMYKDELPSLETQQDVQYFHKAFRQIDVIGGENGGNMDMVFWFLLAEADVFWGCVKKVMNKWNRVEKVENE